MKKWWPRLSLLSILVIAAAAIYVVWPNEPNRYLPSAIPWPSGRGVPSRVAKYLPCHSSQTSAGTTAQAQNANPAANCRGMTLGLDLQGGSRVVMQADPPPGISQTDITSGVDANKSIIESRINPFGVSESVMQR